MTGRQWIELKLAEWNVRCMIFCGSLKEHHNDDFRKEFPEGVGVFWYLRSGGMLPDEQRALQALELIQKETQNSFRRQVCNEIRERLGLSNI